jgi:hypothetical protein
MNTDARLTEEEMQQMLYYRIKGGHGWDALKQISPRTNKPKLLAYMDTLFHIAFAGYCVFYEFSAIKGAYVVFEALMQLALSYYFVRSPQWKHSISFPLIPLTLKLFVDAVSDVVSRKFTQIGFSIIAPMLLTHHSWKNHFMVALIEGGESYATLKRAFQELEIEDFGQRSRFPRPYHQWRIQIRLVIVVDWMCLLSFYLHVASPKTYQGTDVLCPFCSFAVPDKLHWYEHREKTFPRHSIHRQDELLPHIMKKYDPMHGFARVLTSVIDALLSCVLLYLTVWRNIERILSKHSILGLVVLIQRMQRTLWIQMDCALWKMFCLEMQFSFRRSNS